MDPGRRGLGIMRNGDRRRICVCGRYYCFPWLQDGVINDFIVLDLDCRTLFGTLLLWPERWTSELDRVGLVVHVFFFRGRGWA
ncbi:hypothetical protein EX30DRAFT_255775 [Ascodesmis nigricans]|uniref:Uncharacterized protein n=1 Tax=Ascodesmis nigricans TaxID=341454 RepID=A0A4S2MHL1_9PEZI|nr:hypothetical protein EX30DRAFT_255775 [Ascodesmis nigricans]